MPVYEYACDDCRFREDILQSIREPALTQCPKCQSKKFHKLLSAAGFQLKGSGWYASDFKSKAPQSPSSNSSESKSESTKEAAASTTNGCGGSCSCH